MADSMLRLILLIVCANEITSYRLLHLCGKKGRKTPDWDYSGEVDVDTPSVPALDRTNVAVDVETPCVCLPGAGIGANVLNCCGSTETPPGKKRTTSSKEATTTTEKPKPEWSYTPGPTGPDNWPNLGFSKCKGTYDQSPVQVKEWKIKVKRSGIKELHFHGYDKELKGTKLTNDGRTVKLEVPGDDQPNLDQGGLPEDKGPYKFVDLRFRFGNKSGNGAENTFSYKQDNRIMEMQMIHVNDAGLYANLGIFFVADVEDNEAYTPIISGLSKVLYRDMSTTISEPIALQKLLPPSVNPFIRFSGTLTYPPCAATKWTLFEEPVHISMNQVEEFRKLYRTREGDENPELLQGSRRPSKHLGSRSLRRIYGEKADEH